MLGFNPVRVLPQNYQLDWLPNGLLWLRADMGTTIATGVSLWNDIITNGTQNAAQATGADQPTLTTSSSLGNQKVLHFNGTSDWMNLATAISVGGNRTATATVAAVFVNNQTSGTGSILSADGFRLLNILGGDWCYYSQQTGNGAVSTLAGSTAYCLIATQIAANNTATWTNGTTFTLSTTAAGVAGVPTTIGANTSGANQLGAVDLAELFVSSAAWTTNQVTQMRAYFSARYNISV